MKNILVIGLLLLSFWGYSQVYADQEVLSDSEKTAIAEESALALERSEGNIDKVKRILEDWSRKCGMSEPIFRMSILLDISQNKEIDNEITEKRFSHVINYLYRLELKKKDAESIALEYEMNDKYYGYIKITDSYDVFTRNYANALNKQNDLDIVDKLFIALYTDDVDTFLSLLRSEEYKETNIRTVYENEISGIMKMPNGNVALGVGLWMPNGSLNFLGMHPTVGVQIGVHGERLSLDLSIQGRFLQSANEYIVNNTNKYLDTLYSNRHFSAYLGIEPGFTFINTPKHEFAIVTGIGLDLLKVFYPQDYPEEIPSDDRYPISFTTVNLNVGLAYKLKNERGGYWGIAARYEFMNYTNEKGTDLSGNAISFTISRGLLENSLKKQNLEFWKL